MNNHVSFPAITAILSALLLIGCTSGSISQFNAAYRVGPVPAEVSSADYYQEGVAHFKQTEYVLAISAFKRYLSLNPKSTRSLNGIGAV